MPTFYDTTPDRTRRMILETRVGFDCSSVRDRLTDIVKISLKKMSRGGKNLGAEPKIFLVNYCGPVAQMDRAADFESAGWGFESSRDRQ